MYVVPCFNSGEQNWIFIVSQQENPATYEIKLSKQLYALSSQAIEDTGESRRWWGWRRWRRCWYQSNIAICSPFNLFQSATNVVMLNATSSKSEPLILNLNLVLMKMYATSESSVNICRVRRLSPLFNDRLALAFLFCLDCWSTELKSFCFHLQFNVEPVFYQGNALTSHCTSSCMKSCIVQQLF